jgi:hypothetical protein
MNDQASKRKINWQAGLKRLWIIYCFLVAIGTVFLFFFVQQEAYNRPGYGDNIETILLLLFFGLTAALFPVGPVLLRRLFRWIKAGFLSDH